MALNDSIATQIMGELDGMTRSIDDLQGRIELQLKNQAIISNQMAEAKKQFVATLNNLITEAEALKATQVKSIQNQLALSMTQIEAKTNAQIGVFAKAARQRSGEEIDAIADSAAQARAVALNGVLKVIEQKFGDALRSVEGANKSFEEVKGLFINDVAACVDGAEKAVKKYELALQKSASEHQPIGSLGFVLLALLASAISAGSIAVFMTWRSASEDSGQAKLAARGAKFFEVYQQLDEKTQEKINKLWK